MGLVMIDFQTVQIVMTVQIDPDCPERFPDRHLDRKSSRQDLSYLLHYSRRDYLFISGYCTNVVLSNLFFLSLSHFGLSQFK